MSYLLHYYIDADKQAAYEQWVPNFFGGQVSIEDQLRFLMNMTGDEKVVQHEAMHYMYISRRCTNFINLK